MSLFDRFVKAAETIDLNSLVGRVLSGKEQVLIALQKERLGKGLLTTNNPISVPSYSDPWARRRRKAGKQTSAKDLNFSGDHYAGMYANSSKDSTVMGSKDEKSKFLVANWSEDIYGLSFEDIDKLLGSLGVKEGVATEFKIDLLK